MKKKKKRKEEEAEKQLAAEAAKAQAAEVAASTLHMFQMPRPSNIIRRLSDSTGSDHGVGPHPSLTFAFLADAAPQPSKEDITYTAVSL